MSASEETRFLSCHLAEFQSSVEMFSSAQNPGAEDVKEISLKSSRVYDESRDCQKCVFVTLWVVDRSVLSEVTRQSLREFRF